MEERLGREGPLDVPVKELDEMQQPAAGYFPQGELANSPTWPVVIPEGVFPDGWNGQTLIGEMNQPNLVRVLDDEVGGVFQTALVPVFDGSPLGLGNNRMTFGKDGSLYIGKTALSWAGGSGITKVKWNGKPFLSLDTIKAVKNGVELRFSEPLDPATLGTLVVDSHRYKYDANYGSPKMDGKVMDVKANLSDDGLTVGVDVGGLRKGYLHHIDMTGLRSPSGRKVLGANAWYQAVNVPE